VKLKRESVTHAQEQLKLISLVSENIPPTKTMLGGACALTKLSVHDGGSSIKQFIECETSPLLMITPIEEPSYSAGDFDRASNSPPLS
jgi:hypothetical protein